MRARARSVGILGEAGANALQLRTVLELVENLFDAHELPEATDATHRAALYHVPTLLAALTAAMGVRNKRSLPRHIAARLAQRELSLLTRVAPHATRAAEAKPLVRLLIPFIVSREASLRHSRANVLSIIGALLALLPHPETRRHLSFFSRLFMRLVRFCLWALGGNDRLRDRTTIATNARRSVAALPRRKARRRRWRR